MRHFPPRCKTARLSIGIAFVLGHLALAGLANTAGADAVPDFTDHPDFTDQGADDALAKLVGRLIDENATWSSAGLPILEDLAAKGNIQALSALGDSNLAAPADKEKKAKGLAQLEQAAAQHDPDAAVALTFFFLYSDKPDQDYAKARQFAQQAIDLGRREGALALGLIFDNGWGVDRDPAQAAQLMTKSANLGDPYAMGRLARYYHEGFGVQANDVLAYIWATLAVARKPAAEQTKLQDGLALTLLPDEIIAGQHLAASWKPGDDLDARLKAERASPTPLSPDTVPALSSPGPLFPADQPRTKIGDIGIVERDYTDDADLTSDGTKVSTVHLEYEARNESSLKDLGQIAVGFDNAIEQLDILEAYTQKADGRKIAVDPTAILTQQASNSQDNLMFDDRRRKVIIFPNVEVGDVVAYTARWTGKPLIPGMLSIAGDFDPTEQETNARLTFTVPKSTPLFFETHGLDVSRSAKGDRLVYQIMYANRRPLSQTHTVFDEFDAYPRIFASNFRDYRQFVRAYLPLIEPKIVVTPQVQAMADKLTGGITDRHAQAEAIYNWVSRHIRYVGIEFGVGGVVPHDADKILTVGYGDCKDHSVLFAALLKAKGIGADLVLISSGRRMSISVPPRIQNFDHMITYIPEFDLYADTTAEVAPFGTLPFYEYGKPVVHVSHDALTSDKPVVRRVPTVKADVATLTMKTTAHLQSDGKVVGDSETVAGGPYSIDLRLDAAGIQGNDPAQVAIKWLKDDGYDGTGSFDFLPPHEMTPSYRLAGHFQTEAYDGLLKGSQFNLPRGLLDGWSPGSWLMGPLNFKGGKDDPTFCWSGHEIEELSLELPAGTHLAKLPSGINLEDDHLTYRSTWTVTGETATGQTVMVHREFISKIDTPICVGTTRLKMLQVLQQIKSDQDTKIALTAN